jgi:ABC-type uncharacterized transport system permease subunit
MNTRSVARTAFVLIPIGVSLAITSLLVVSVGQDPLAVFTKIWEGAFRNTESTAGVVNFWIPLVLCGMGLVLTFTAGLWNIGVEGQMMMGALFASWAARTLPLPPLVLVPVEIVLAMLGGALWGLLVGVLKLRFGVHEIFGGVGLNAIASVYAIYLIAGPWAPPTGGTAQATDPFPPDSLLLPMADSFPVSMLALAITAIAIVTVIVVLRRTRWGLELKATGRNSRSALLLGVATTRTMLSAFMVCGMLAGIGGAYRVLFTYDSLRPNVSGGIGFLGLLVVLLTGSRALWVPLVTFAFAAILAGSTRLRIALGLDASLAGVLQGTLVLVVLLFNGVRERLLLRRAASADGGASPASAAPTPEVSAKAAAHE